MQSTVKTVLHFLEDWPGLELEDEVSNLEGGDVRIVVCGDIATGKTSLLRRSVGKILAKGYQATSSVDVVLVLRWRGGVL